MHRLTSISLKQRAVVVLLTLLVALMGFFSVTRLRSELLPNIEIPLLTVITAYPGAGPEAVDQQVTMPISQALTGAQGVLGVNATSSEGFSLVAVEFDYGEDMAARQEDLASAVAGLTLPDGAMQPSVERINLQQFPIVQVSLTSGADGDISQLRALAQQEYLPALSSAEKVSRIEIVGGSDDEVEILLDPAQMAASGITADQITGALRANNISIPAGSLASGDTTLPVRVDSQITTLDGMRGLIVGASAEGEPITLGDIATVEIVTTEASGVSLTNGNPSVAIDVYMAQGANTVETAASVRDQLDGVTERLATSDTQVETTILLDQSEFIEESIDALVREASFGAVFAIVVILVFLLSVRSTLVTAISIPLSVLIAFILLWWQGISLNIMTLGGLAVAVGRVVDDSIVVLEAIYRHVQRGEDTREATLNGTKEVALAITASTLTTVAVFLPLAFVGGIIGEIFRPFALTVTFSLLASLLVALTIVPVMSSFFIRRDKVRPVSANGNWMTRIYEPVLRLALRRPVWTLVLAAALLIGSFGLTPFIGTSFLPSSGEKGVVVTVDYPAGTSQEATLEQATELEQVIRDTTEVETVQTQVGGDGLTAAFTGATNSRATMTVIFDHDVDLAETVTNVRDALNGVAGDASILVENMDSAVSGQNSVSVVVQGNDYARVSEVTQQLTEQIAGVENVSNVENDIVTAKPELRVTVDPDAAAQSGTASAAVAAQVRLALAGSESGQVTIDNVPYTVTLRYEGVDSAETLATLPVAAGGQVTLGDVATIEETDGPTQITRIDGARSATITGVITTDETGGPIADVAQIVADFEAPEGVDVSSGGLAEQQGEAFTSMALAILFAIAAVYIVMVASFNSLTTPFVILFSLPLAIIGVLLALFISGKSLGLPALIGLLMLVGIVVTNAIVLLEYVIELRRRGFSLRDALIQGGKTRLRPILMTAIATILALTPLALSGEGGAIIASDLAVVVIGGLLTSTLLTLFIVPVIYELIGGWQERRAMRRKGRDEARKASAGQELATTPAE